MTKVTNKHDGLINVAGIDVRPGATVQVPDDAFKKWSHGNAAKQWLKAGVVHADTKVDLKDVPAASEADESAALRAKATALGISFSDETTDEDLANAVKEAMDEQQPGPDDRDALLAEARSLGLNPNANTGTDKLKKLIADKKAQA